MFSADDCDARRGGCPVGEVRRPSQEAAGHLRAVSPPQVSCPLPPDALSRGEGAARMTSKELGRCRRASLCTKGKTLHSSLMGQPLPPRAPHGTSGESGPFAFFAHSVSLLSPLAGPDLPLSAQRAMSPLSCLSLREGRRGRAEWERREPHCSSAMLGRLHTS